MPDITRRCRNNNELARARNLCAGHLRQQFGPGHLEKICRLSAVEHIKSARDKAGPAGLVAGPEARTVVAVEILVEQNGVFPVRIFLKLACSAIHGPLAIRIAEKNAC